MRLRPSRALVPARAALALSTAVARAEGSRVSGFRGVTKGSRLEHVEDLVLHNVALEPAQ